MSQHVHRNARFAAAAVGIVAALALSACGSSGGGSTSSIGEVTGKSYSGPPVTLQFWNPFTGPDGPYFQQLVDDFNDENPNIKVKVTTLAYADFYDKLSTSVRSNKGPDVAVMHLSEIASEASKQSILPIDPISDALGFQESDFAPAVWQGGIYKGERYGIPLDVPMIGLYYNKTLMAQAGLDPEQPPTNDEEYQAALEALKAAGIEGHWIDPYGFTRVSFDSLIAQFGGSSYSEDGAAAVWDSEAGVKALTWLRSLIDNGYSPKNVNADAGWTAFKQNENAFIWTGIWSAGDPDLDKIDWGVAPIPNIGGTPAVWGDSHQFVATQQIADDENKQEAVAYFINKVSADSITWAQAPAVPARSSVRDTPEFQAMLPQSIFAEQVDDVVTRPTFPGLTEPQGLLDEAINLAITGKKEPQEALSDTAKRATKILQENKTKYDY